MANVMQIRRRCVDATVVVVALHFLAGHAMADDKKPPAKAPKTAAPANRTGTTNSRDNNQHSQVGKKLQNQRRDSDPDGAPLTAFTDPEGHTVLTAQPEKYRGKAGYTEIPLDINPIKVPQQYRKRTVAADFSEANIAGLAHLYANKNAVDEKLIIAMVHVLSKGDPTARSANGGLGLMLITPDMAKEFGVHNTFDPAENIAAGTQYMARLLREFKDDQALALEAYLTGSDAVKKRGVNPPPEETETFVRRVLAEVKAVAVKVVEVPVASAGTDKPKASNVPITISHSPEPQYTVRFKSGNMQMAESVETDGDYFYIAFRGKNIRLNKALVDSVTPEPVHRANESIDKHATEDGTK